MSKYTVVGVFRQAHKDCDGETVSNLSYNEMLKLEKEWKNNRKYKEVFHTNDED